MYGQEFNEMISSIATFLQNISRCFHLTISQKTFGTNFKNFVDFSENQIICEEKIIVLQQDDSLEKRFRILS